MDITIWQMCVATILILYASKYNCELEHPYIFKEINGFANNSRIIDGIFKPENGIGEGGFGAVWKGDRFCDFL